MDQGCGIECRAGVAALDRSRQTAKLLVGNAKHIIQLCAVQPGTISVF
jgi:hypothetical protein